MNRKHAFILLAITILGLGLMNAWMYSIPIATTPIASQSTNEQLVSEGVKSEVGASISADDGIGHALARPLFASTRRPWTAPALVSAPVVAVQPVEQPSPLPSEPPSFVILGIQKIPSGSKALLAHTGQADAQWYGKGEVIDGWSVTEISASIVKIERDAQMLQLDLYPIAPALPVKSGDTANISPPDGGIAPEGIVSSAPPAAQAGAQ